MGLQKSKLVSLKQKLEEKALLEEEIVKVDEKITTLVGEEKEKITKKKK